MRREEMKGASHLKAPHCSKSSASSLATASPCITKGLAPPPNSLSSAPSSNAGGARLRRCLYERRAGVTGPCYRGRACPHRQRAVHAAAAITPAFRVPFVGRASLQRPAHVPCTGEQHCKWCCSRTRCSSAIVCLGPLCTQPATAYICGDCGAENTLKPGDVIRCRECGYRILYKKRTKRVVQYEARQVMAGSETLMDCCTCFLRCFFRPSPMGGEGSLLLLLIISSLCLGR